MGFDLNLKLTSLGGGFRMQKSNLYRTTGDQVEVTPRACPSEGQQLIDRGSLHPALPYKQRTLRV
jgi:hypothetical protein